MRLAFFLTLSLANASGPVGPLKPGCLGALTTHQGLVVTDQDIATSAAKLEELIRSTMIDHSKVNDARLIKVIGPWVEAIPARVEKIVRDFGHGHLAKELIADPEMRSYATAVQSAFVNPKQTSAFFKDLYVEVVRRAGVDPWWGPGQAFVEANKDLAPEAIRQIAKERGFSSEIEIPKDKIFIEGSEFRTQYLKANTVIIDQGAKHTSHGVYSHYLQMLYMQDILDKKFGDGAANKFISYLSTEEGFKIWFLMFDLGPTFFSQPGHPRFYTVTNLSGGVMGLP